MENPNEIFVQPNIKDVYFTTRYVTEILGEKRPVYYVYYLFKFLGNKHYILFKKSFFIT